MPSTNQERLINERIDVGARSRLMSSSRPTSGRLRDRTFVFFVLLVSSTESRAVFQALDGGRDTCLNKQETRHKHLEIRNEHKLFEVIDLAISGMTW